MTEREKMLSGEWFDPRDAELTANRNNTLYFYRFYIV